MKVKVKGVAYIDDLRNTMNKDGKWIKPHLLYRSANLSKITDKGQLLHDKYHVCYVFDLRTDAEEENKPEPLIDEIKYFHAPMADNYENPIITKENRLKILKELSNREGGSKEYMRQFYPLMITSPRAIEVYKLFFKTLLEAKDDEAILFHCTQGKDRTGVLLMLLLSALNVHEQVIINKYMEYNIINWRFRTSVKFAMSLFKSPRLAVQLDHVLSARLSYIKSAIGEIKNKYRNVNNYLTNVIGLTDNDIDLLRKKYLR